MDDVVLGGLAILLLLMVILMFFNIVRLFVTGYLGYEVKQYLGPYILLRDLKKPYRAAVQENMPYYDKLDLKDKRRFEKRVQRFIDMKKFIPRGELLEVTPEMKSLVAGTAIKLTFGYPMIYLSHFWRILMYQNNYYSEITKKFHKGEVHTRGHIILSWKNFLHGHTYHADGINLGLHEMAHALRIENAIRNQEYNFLDFEALYAFTILSKREIQRMKEGKMNMLRIYATANEHEFFSVFVENFFERPALLKEEHPKMYECMRRILKQDPSIGSFY